ncbi:MAG: exosome complex RNA-binding protein Csl4 [Candidatus Methanospirareceae archaeon]|nr:exosome complex RNA-binding protein Csl4 [Methanophagales archaeon]HDN68313.1 RNA-binding protein [Methanomicrobia archaeon]
MEKDKNETIVIPGDFVGTSEEFTAGNGVCAEEGNLFALQIGEVSVNEQREISVLPAVETPPVIKEGTVVVGRVEDLKEMVAVVSLACVVGKEQREIVAPTQAVIHISNVKTGYVNELQQEFGVLDLVKAKVIDAKALRLSTEERDLGVIKAMCGKCKSELKRKGNVLVCERCRREETRKISYDYGKGVV